jgi:hypothetical protein
MYNKCIDEYIAQKLKGSGPTPDSIDPRLQDELYSYREKLQAELNRTAKKLEKEFPEGDLGRMAAIDAAVDELAGDMINRRLRLINNATALSDAMKYIDTPVSGYSREALLNKYVNEIADQGEHIFLRQLNDSPELLKFVEEFRSKRPWLQDSMDPDEAHRILLAMEGKEGVEKLYVDFANAVTKFKDKQLEYLRSMGVNVKQLQNYSLSMLQSPYKVHKMGRANWVKFMDENFEHVNGLTGADKLKALNDRFDEYITGRVEGQGHQFVFDMNNSLNVQRHWLPKSPEVAVKTIMELGPHSSVYHSLLESMRLLVLEGEIVRKLGSTPEATLASLRKFAVQQDVLVPNPKASMVTNPINLDATFDQLLGRTTASKPIGSVTSKFNEFMTGVNNSVSATVLNWASLATIGDLKNISLLARRFGDFHTGVFSDVFRQMSVDKDLARALMYSAEDIFNGIRASNRFGDIEGVGKFSQITAAASNTTNRVSGVSAITKALQDMSAKYTNHKIASKIASVDNIRQLDNAWFNYLNLHGITDKDFVAMKAALNQGQIDPRLLPRDTEAKLWAAISFENYAAIAMPDMEIKGSVLRAGIKSNTAIYPFIKAMTAIKGFFFGNLIKSTRTLMAHPLVENRVGYFVQNAALSLLFGGLYVQAKEAASGRDMMDMTSPEFFMRSFIAGSGAFGLEFVIQQAMTAIDDGSWSTFNKAASVTFPAFTMYAKLVGFSAESIAALVIGDADKFKESLAEGVDKGFDNIPGNAWFFQRAQQVLFLKQFAYWLSPEYEKKDKARIKRRQKDTGQGEWLPVEGDIRTPEIAEDNTR